MKIKKSVYNHILNDTFSPPPESGGILGKSSEVISEYYPDRGCGEHSISHYVPDIAKLNHVIEIWQKKEICFCGIYHSHYEGDTRLSKGDKSYIERILRKIHMHTDTLYFPLVFPRNEIICYSVALTSQGLIICKEEIILID